MRIDVTEDDIAQGKRGDMFCFFRLAGGEITILQAENLTGLVIIDQTHPSLF